MIILDTTPKDDGFHMPGEFEQHQGCWMLWPERCDNWRMGAKPAQYAFAETAKAIVGFEPVTVCVSAGQFQNARHLLDDRIRLVEMSSDDAWMRDIGPTFVVNHAGSIRGIDWNFNAWGGIMEGIYFPWNKDAAVAQKIMEMERIDIYKAPFVLEGGSIHTDGEGTVLATRECLLNSNRNPDLNEYEIEELLKKYLNAEKILWLNKGVFLDETNGHVDNLCCFVKPGEVLLTWTDDKSDPQYEISEEACQFLLNSVDAMGRKLVVHKIHQPGPLYRTREDCLGIDFDINAVPREQGERLTASYVNFYIANNGIVMPLFNDAFDEPAKKIFQQIFPDRKIVGVPCREILLGGGNIHCITQQQPGKSVI